MKKFMSDSEIVHRLMLENFNDDRTFSKSRKGFAILGVYTNEPILDDALYDTQFEDFQKVELKLFDKNSFYEFFKENKDKIVLQGIQGMSPIISIGEVI